MTFAAALPAIASALPGILGMFGGGGGDKLKKVSNYSPGQTKVFDLLNQLTQQTGAGAGNALELLQQYLDPNSEIYKNFEQPYLQQFEQETVPMLAERFAGGGALSSSGFGQALSSAGSNLQTNLAQMKSGLQRQSINDILNLFSQLTGQSLGAEPFTNVNKQKGGGGLTSFLGGLSSRSPGSWGDIGGGIQSAIQGFQGNKLINMAQGIKG